MRGHIFCLRSDLINDRARVQNILYSKYIVYSKYISLESLIGHPLSVIMLLYLPTEDC